MEHPLIKSNIEYSTDWVKLHFMIFDHAYVIDITDAVDRISGCIVWSKVADILVANNFNPDVATKLSISFSMAYNDHRDKPVGTIDHKQHPFARFRGNATPHRRNYSKRS